MRMLSERLVGNYEIVATEKEAEKLPLNELLEWPENLCRQVTEAEAALNAERVAHAESRLWRRVTEAEAALNVERVAHAECRQKFKELIVAEEDGVSPRDVSRSSFIEVGGERDTSINSSAAASMTEFREVRTTAELEFKSQLDKDRTHTNYEVGGGEKQLKNKWAVEFKVDETITIIEVEGKKRAKAKAEIGAEEAIFILISISKSANLTIEFETLTDGAARITAAKKKKHVSSTTVIEVGEETRMKMAHADTDSMTKCSEVKSTAKRITDDADWQAKIERGGRIFERIRVRTDKVAKSA
jgi:hypothetical protein